MRGLGIILRGPSKKRARIGTAGASSGVLPKYQLGLWTTFKWQSGTKKDSKTYIDI